ncbi:MAG TPA: phosphatase PAP2 family protein [Longimicrobiales bacterium]|nr:phosphatase PAP2 family protein [Longimicrobiales bacterium]
MASADFWRRSLRRLFALYLFVSGIALFFPHRPRAWPVLVLLHAVAMLLLLGAVPLSRITNPLSARWPQLMRAVRDWYLLLLVPLLYSELAVLNVAVHNGRYFDDIILNWEQQLFGGQPSRELAVAYPDLWLSELLHFSYIAYYLIIYGPFLLLYLRGRIEDHQRAAFVILLTFFAHYVFFIYFPVQGPRYLFAAPGGELADGTMYNLAHRILEAGSSRGAAFPSSHVGVAFAQTAMSFLLLKRWAPLLTVLSTGLAVGAVYGGFHYATDAVIGFIYALLLVPLAPILARALAGEKS